MNFWKKYGIFIKGFMNSPLLLFSALQQCRHQWHSVAVRITGTKLVYVRIKLLRGDRMETCWNGIWKYFWRHDSNRNNWNKYIFEGEFQDWTAGRIKTVSWEVKLHKTKLGRRNITAWSTACFEKQIVSQPVKQTVSQPVKQIVSQPVKQMVSQPVKQIVSQTVKQSRKSHAHVCRVRSFNAIFTEIRYLSLFWSKYLKTTAFYHIPLIWIFLFLTATYYPRRAFTTSLIWIPTPTHPPTLTCMLYTHFLLATFIYSVYHVIFDKEYK
jgi:hypothetical protein